MRKANSPVSLRFKGAFGKKEFHKTHSKHADRKFGVGVGGVGAILTRGRTSRGRCVAVRWGARNALVRCFSPHYSVTKFMAAASEL